MLKIAYATTVGFVLFIIAGGMAQAQPVNDSSGSNTFLLLAFVLGAIWLGFKFFKDRKKRTAQTRVLNAATSAMMPIAKEFPFYLVSDDASTLSVNALCMDSEGQRLRFVKLNYLDGKIMDDQIVPISSVVSIELSGGNEVITDYETTSDKPNALPAAVIGGLLFGKTGAIVGATAAGSRETSVAARRTVEKPSVLVFGLSDLSNPVLRFTSTDHEQCDIWLHRVKSAMANIATVKAQQPGGG